MEIELRERIIYCDANCVVVNKIAGEAVEGAGPGMVDLPRKLADELSAGFDQSSAADVFELPAAVHRLDVPVSGCVLFARNKTALAFLNESFKSSAEENNTIEKKYWAIVEMPDNLPPDFAELVHWIQFDSRKNKSIAHDEPRTGLKKAVLRYRVVGKGRNYLFMEIDLVTGRHHQIRAQFERLGLHVKGDLKYGAKRSEPAGGIRLHARSLSFPTPTGTGERITVQALPPLRDNLWITFEEAAGNL